MNYDGQRGFLCRGIDGRLGFGQGRGEPVGPATILVFPTPVWQKFYGSLRGTVTDNSAADTYIKILFIYIKLKFERNRGVFWGKWGIGVCWRQVAGRTPCRVLVP